MSEADQATEPQCLGCSLQSEKCVEIDGRWYCATCPVVVGDGDDTAQD